VTTPHLILVSLGPVQDFIAQARRTRDLWFGSHLLSELSRAAAKALAIQGTELIFPALGKDDPEFEACDEPTRPGRDIPPLSIANKLLAEAPAGIDPSGCVRAARGAVQDRWRGIAGRVRSKRHNVLAANIDDVWYEQIDDVLEFYAVWVPLGSDYITARKTVEQALAGRKNLRDFRAWQVTRDGAPKSSLDGARVSVLPRNQDRTHPDFRRFGIRPGEQLDAVGLVKRTGFEPDRFIPLVNVAAGDWLHRAQQAAPRELLAVAAACKDKKISAIDRNMSVIRPFRFDASVLYPSRWPTLFSELEVTEAPDAAREWGEQHIRPLLDAMRSEPPSYVACLVADGDRMGKAIDILDTPEANRQFSRALAKFPQRARTIVESDHCGSLVYAGGDDVLAFLPVATAFACARALAEAFRAALKDTVPPAQTPTLSVGIGIGHVLDSMASLLQRGKDAERAAKDAGRNALAVIVDKRSGGQRQFAQSWDLDPVSRIAKDAVLLDDALATGKVHALEALLKRFPAPATVTAETSAMAAAFICYANDLLAHTGETASKVSLRDFATVTEHGDYGALHAEVAASIDRLLSVRLMREAGYDGKGI
jgi:CRISPR-associated protein Cmr2